MCEKSLPLTVITTTLPILKDVHAAVDEYQRKKQIRERLLGAINNDIEAIGSSLDSIAEIGEKQFYPLLKTIHVAPTRTQMNEIVKSIIQFYRNYRALLIAFEGLANKCKQISKNTGFMKQLESFSPEVFDLINRMSETVAKNHIEFNDSFYGFLQLYGDEPFKKIKRRELAEIEKEIEKSIDLVNKVIKPSLRRESIDRNIRKEFTKACKELIAVSKRYKVKYTKIVDIKSNVPTKLRNVVNLFEKAYPLESELKNEVSFRKKKAR